MHAVFPGARAVAAGLCHSCVCAAVPIGGVCDCTQGLRVSLDKPNDKTEDGQAAGDKTAVDTGGQRTLQVRVVRC